MNSSIRLYNILLGKNFTKEEAETVVSEIEDVVDRKFENVRNTLATKMDLHEAVLDLKRDISSVKDSLKRDISSIKDSVKGDVSSVKDNVKGDIASVKDSINKVIIWMVGLILGQTGLIFLILKLVGVFE